MLIKQPGSYRKFCTLTLGGCPGPSTALQGGLWLLSVQAGKKEGVDGCELMEEKPPLTLGQCPPDGKEKTFGCCMEPHSSKQGHGLHLVPTPWWRAVVLFV